MMLLILFLTPMVACLLALLSLLVLVPMTWARLERAPTSDIVEPGDWACLDDIDVHTHAHTHVYTHRVTWISSVGASAHMVCGPPIAWGHVAHYATGPPCKYHARRSWRPRDLCCLPQMGCAHPIMGSRAPIMGANPPEKWGLAPPTGVF